MDQLPRKEFSGQTDQLLFLEEFKKRYRNKVIDTDSIRLNTNINPIDLVDFLNYQKGEQVLIGALLLAKTNYLIKNGSYVAEAAICFNPPLEYFDLTHESAIEDFLPKKDFQR